jgi:hypothetical protein
MVVFGDVGGKPEGWNWEKAERKMQQGLGEL